MQAHDDRNLARQLTPAEKKEKKTRKLLGAAAEGEACPVSLYRIGSLASPQNRFKVRVNAEVRLQLSVSAFPARHFSLAGTQKGFALQRVPRRVAPCCMLSPELDALPPMLHPNVQGAAVKGIPKVAAACM